MDPLGARPTILAASEICRWSKDDRPKDPLSSGPSIIGNDLPRAHKTPPFGVREDMNDKLALWSVTATCLNFKFANLYIIIYVSIIILMK